MTSIKAHLLYGGEPVVRRSRSHNGGQLRNSTLGRHGIGVPVNPDHLLPAGNPLGARLRELRLDEELTLTEMGARVGTSGERVGEYEHGHRIPTLHMLCRYADAFATTVSAVLDGVM